MGRGRPGWNGDWCTPPEYLERVRRVFEGRIVLDPCSNRWSEVRAEVEWLAPRSDGLELEWDHPTIYVHPPYAGRQGPAVDPWLAKCADAARRHFAQVIALVPVDVNSAAWRRDVWGSARAVCFIFSQRVRFFEGGHAMKAGALASYAFIYWGAAFAHFEEEFRHLGAVVDLLGARLPGPGNAHRFKLLAPAGSGR